MFVSLRTHRLLDRRQMPWDSAAFTRSSRKSGWASEISISARSQVLRPTRLTQPYSVTMKYAWLRGAVAMSPSRDGLMRECSTPSRLVNVDFMQMKPLPPFESAAPSRKSSWPAGAGDLARAAALGADLPVQVDLHAVVDGDHVVDAADDAHVVDVGERRDDDRGVVVHPLVELLRAKDHAGHALPAVQVQGLVRQLAGLVQLVVGVPAELGVHAQVLEVRLRQPRANHVGQAADAQLERGAVPHVLQDVVRHPDLLLACLRDGKLGKPGCSPSTT